MPSKKSNVQEDAVFKFCKAVVENRFTQSDLDEMRKIPRFHELAKKWAENKNTSKIANVDQKRFSTFKHLVCLPKMCSEVFLLFLPDVINLNNLKDVQFSSKTNGLSKEMLANVSKMKESLDADKKRIGDLKKSLPGLTKTLDEKSQMFKKQETVNKDIKAEKKRQVRESFRTDRSLQALEDLTKFIDETGGDSVSESEIKEAFTNLKKHELEIANLERDMGKKENEYNHSKNRLEMVASFLLTVV